MLKCNTTTTTTTNNNNYIIMMMMMMIITIMIIKIDIKRCPTIMEQVFSKDNDTSCIYVLVVLLLSLFLIFRLKLLLHTILVDIRIFSYALT